MDLNEFFDLFCKKFAPIDKEYISLYFSPTNNAYKHQHYTHVEIVSNEYNVDGEPILNYDEAPMTDNIDIVGDDEPNNYCMTNIGHEKKFRWNKPNDKTCIFSTLNSTNIDKFNDISTKEDIYSIDMFDIHSKFKQNIKNISINLGGGRVFPVETPKYYGQTKTAPKNESNVVSKTDDLSVSILDFNSLYPSVMIWSNCCFNTCALYSNFAIYINKEDKYYSGNDDRISQKFLVCLKINTTFVPTILRVVRTSIKLGYIPHIQSNMAILRQLAKDKMKIAKNEAERNKYNSEQNARKLLMNVIYGTFVFPSSNNPFFIPSIGSLITTCSRRFFTTTFLKCLDFFNKNNLLDREVIYGDTDSIFIYCTINEVNMVLEEIHNLTCFRNLKLKLEGSYPQMFLLTKKCYIGITDKNEIYAKNIFKSSSTTGSVVFLTALLHILFDKQNNNLNDQTTKLDGLFQEFLNLSDSCFFKSMKMSHELVDYKNLSGILTQVKWFINNFGVEIGAGTTLNYSYYDHIFYTIGKTKSTKVDYNSFGLNVIPVNSSNTGLVSYLREKSIFCTLICNVVPHFKIKHQSLKINRAFCLEKDYKPIIDNVMLAFKNHGEDNFEQNFKTKWNLLLNLNTKPCSGVIDDNNDLFSKKRKHDKINILEAKKKTIKAK
jgi:hypothetical protein